MSRKRLFDARAALACGLVLVLTSCGPSDGVLGVDQGRVRFVLSAGDAVGVQPASGEDATTVPTTGADGATLAPDFDGDGPEHAHWIQSANVTFSSILARNLDGVLVNVDMDLPTTVDVVTMEDGRQIVLPDGELSPGTYDQLVVVMTEVEVVLSDGTGIAITPPGGGWTAIIPVCPFTVAEGETTVVGLAFDVRSAFRWQSNRFFFHPRIHCED
jgi:hypothetical protein